MSSDTIPEVPYRHGRERSQPAFGDTGAVSRGAHYAAGCRYLRADRGTVSGAEGRTIERTFGALGEEALPVIPDRVLDG